MQGIQKDVDTLQAELWVLVGDPNRAMMIHNQQAEGPRKVNHLTRAIGSSSSSATGHLAFLRNRQLVSAHRDGHRMMDTLAAPPLVNDLNNAHRHSLSTFRAPREHHSIGKVL